MYARSTLDNYAKAIKNADKQSEFRTAVSAIRGEIRNGVEIIMADAMKAAGLDAHVAALEEKKAWLYLTNTGKELEVLYGERYEARMV